MTNFDALGQVKKEKKIFGMSQRLSDYKITQHRIFLKGFSISLGFSRFFRSYFALPNPFVLVGHETGSACLGFL